MKHWYRKQKRILNWYMKRVRPGMFVVDCRNHPCVVTKFHWYKQGGWVEGDIDVISLVNGKPSSCSLFHCGIEPISENLANEMVKFIKNPNNDWYDYLQKYSKYSDQDIEHYKKLDEVWNFEKVDYSENEI